jgi:biopolymer transport protein ExbB
MLARLHLGIFMKRFTSTTTAFFSASLLAGAQESAQINQKSFLKIIDEGGMMMYPLALLSVAGVVLILLYLVTIRRNAVVSDRFMDTAEAMIRKRDFLGLMGYCKKQNESMARIAHKTLYEISKCIIWRGEGSGGGGGIETSGLA